MTDWRTLTPHTAKPRIIDWWDIVKTDNWNDAETPGGLQVSSLGWLLEDAPTHVLIATSYKWEDGEWSDLHTFTKSPPEDKDVMYYYKEEG